MQEDEDTNSILNEMLNEGISLDRTSYLAYVYGPPEWWPKDVENALPGVFKTVSDDDRVGPVKGSA
jgi:hypothetical protein